MTTCAGCRVRHLKCDTQSPCTECNKNGRECRRLNVRFRNLVCPSERITLADHSKYEFFFDNEQTWIETSTRLRFVDGDDSSDETSLSDKLEETVFDAMGSYVETQPPLLEKRSPTFKLRSTFNTPINRTSDMDDDLSNAPTILEHIPSDSGEHITLDSDSRTPFHSPRGSSQLIEHLSVDTRTSCLEDISRPRQLISPLKSLQEGKLFQHWINHLAPWVCMNLLIN